MSKEKKYTEVQIIAIVKAARDLQTCRAEIGFPLTVVQAVKLVLQAMRES